MCVCVCVRACVRACVRVCARACACTHVPRRVRARPRPRAHAAPPPPPRPAPAQVGVPRSAEVHMARMELLAAAVTHGQADLEVQEGG